MLNSQSTVNDKLQALVKEGNTDAAVKFLYESIVEAARRKEFPRAEALLEQLYEVNSMALNEIVKSGEIIEHEKCAAINPNHKEIWISLYSTLSRDEANAFFYAMEEKSVGADEHIITRGESSPVRLIFINAGQAKIVWRDGETEVLLGVIGPGGLAGHDTFFGISTATYSLIALTPVVVSELNKEKIKGWEKTLPSLLSMLKNYCLRFETPGSMVRRRGVERRRHERFYLTGKVKFELLNSSGKVIGKLLKGDLSNISKGGLSFQLFLSNHESAVTLLGRGVRMTFSIGDGINSSKCEMEGTLAGVTNLWQNEYAVHVRFNTSFPDHLMGDLPLVKINS